MAIRFKIQHKGSPVTLSIKPGTTVRHYEFEPTDEGWSSQYFEYGLDRSAQVLRHEVVDDGTDCDGRLTRYHCFVAMVASIDSDRWPVWTDEGGSQRDYAAEAMGY